MNKNNHIENINNEKNKNDQIDNKNQFLNKRLEEVIQNIFPQINIETDKLMEDLNSKYKKGQISKEDFIILLTQGLIKIFLAHDDEFIKYDFKALEFMKNMQRYSRELINFLEKLTDQQLKLNFKNTGNETNSAELVKIFFRILGRTPK